MRLDLVNNRNDRELVMKEENQSKLLNMLRKLGNVVDYMTEPMVAEFYGVSNKCIENYGNRNSKELSNYGYKVYKRNEILNLQVEGLENIPNRGLRLYPIQAVIVIGMMLTESKVAEQLRSEIINELFVPTTPVIDPFILSLHDIVIASRSGDDVQLAVAIGKRDKLIRDIEVKPLEEIINKFLSGTGTYTSTQVAKLYGISSAKKLNKMLNEKHLIYKQGKSWLPYASADNSWFKIVVGESNGHNHSQLRITPKGVIEISKLLDIEMNEKELEDLI